jgi:hypothetical protein
LVSGVVWMRTSPNGADYESPGQRPGNRSGPTEPALKGRSNLSEAISRSRSLGLGTNGPPFQGLGFFHVSKIPGRCPGLELGRAFGAATRAGMIRTCGRTSGVYMATNARAGPAPVPRWSKNPESKISPGRRHSIRKTVVDRLLHRGRKSLPASALRTPQPAPLPPSTSVCRDPLRDSPAHDSPVHDTPVRDSPERESPVRYSSVSRSFASTP